MLSPAPSTGRIRAQARASRTGRSSGPARSVSVAPSSASSKRSAMVTTDCPAMEPPPPVVAGDHARMEGGAPPRRQVLPYGDRALLVEVGEPADVAALRTALERTPLSGQCELVPAARTVLVVLDRTP